MIAPPGAILAGTRPARVGLVKNSNIAMGVYRSAQEQLPPPTTQDAETKAPDFTSQSP